MPCMDWFAAQDQAYRDSVLPPSVRARVSVEAGIAMPWYRWVGDAGEIVSHRALRRQRRLPDPVPRVRLHHRARRHRRPHQPRPRLPRDRVTDIVRPDPTQREEPLMAPNERLAALSAAGVSIWLDDLSRERLTSGNLQELITDKSVVGVTTNPTIFAAALANGQAYDAQVRELAARGAVGRRHRPRGHRRRRPAGLRRVLRHLGAHAAASTAGSRSRSARCSRATPRPPWPRRWTCGRPSTGPTCWSRSRPPRRACRRSPARWPRGSASTSR